MDGDELQAKLKRLPRRAIVAFAVRCARRVLPLYESYGDPDFYGRPPDPAIREILNAADRWIGGGDDYPQNLGSVAWLVASDARDATAEVDAAAASVAARAANAAAAAAAACDVADPWTAAGAAADAAIFTDAAADAAKIDLTKLLASNLSPADMLGPLWPDGEPSWYTDAATQAEALAGAKALAVERERQSRAEMEIPSPGSSESGPLGPLWPNGEPEWYREAVAKAEVKARESKPSED